MKARSVLVLCICLASCVCYGQSYRALQRGFLNEVNQIVPAGDHLLVLGQWKDSSSSKSFELQKVRIENNELHRLDTVSFGGEEMSFNYLLPVENGYYGLGFERGCKVRPKGNYLYELSDELLLVSPPTKIEYAFITVSDPITSFLLLDQSTAVFASNGLLLSYDIRSRERISFNNQVDNTSHLIKNDPGTFSAIQGNAFNTYDIQCKLVKSNTIGFTPKHLDTYPGGFFLAVGNEKLVVLSKLGSTLFEQSWSTLSSSFDSLNYSYWASDTLHLIGKKSTYWVKGVFDQNFNPIHLDTIGNTSFEQYAFVPYKNQLLSGARLLGAAQTIEGLAWYEKGSRPDLTEYDLELTEMLLSPDTLRTRVKGGTYETLKANVLVTVKNNSEDTVKSFFINWESSNNSIAKYCDLEKRGYEGKRDIAPGKSQELLIPIVDSFVSSDQDYELCLSVSSPNQHFDLKADNNTQCLSRYLPPLSIDKVATRGLIFKNPVRPGEFLSLPELPNDLIIEMIGIDGKTFSLPLHNQGIVIPQSCTSGMYLFRARDEKWRFTEKILVVD